VCRVGGHLAGNGCENAIRFQCTARTVASLHSRLETLSDPAWLANANKWQSLVRPDRNGPTMIEDSGHRRYSRSICMMLNIFDPRVPCLQEGVRTGWLLWLPHRLQRWTRYHDGRISLLPQPRGRAIPCCTVGDRDWR
jgi:hypothetical protein